MKKYIMSVLVILIAIDSGAQFRDLTKRDSSNQKSILTDVLMGSQTEILTYSLLAKKEDTITEKFIRGDVAVKRFGEKGRRGVIVETLKPGLILLTLSEVLNWYHLDGENIKLPVFIDSIKVQSPLTMIAVQRSIAKVNIVGPAKRYKKVISIITVNPFFMQNPVGSEKL